MKLYLVIYDELMNYYSIARSVNGAETVADIIQIGHEYVESIRAGESIKDPHTIASGKYDSAKSTAAYIALRETIASVNRSVARLQKQSETNAANVSKRTAGQLMTAYAGKIDGAVVEAVAADAIGADHPKQYVASVIDRLIREGKTTIEAYDKDKAAHAHNRPVGRADTNPALNYQRGGIDPEVLDRIGKDFWKDLEQ